MNDAIQTFLDRVQAAPKFVEAVRENPEFNDHFLAIVNGIEQVHRLGNESSIWLGRYDAINDLLSREDLTLQARLLELALMFEPWRVEYMAKRGH